jgi:hypothetical protein
MVNMSTNNKLSPFISSALNGWNLNSNTLNNRFYLNLRWGVLFFFFLGFSSKEIYSQCNLSCKSNIQVSLSQNGTSTVTPAMLLAANPGSCFAQLQVLMFEGTNQISNTVNCSHAGKTLTARLFHPQTNSFCTSSVLIEDKLAPRLTLSDTIVWCNATALPATTGTPTATDNCSSNVIFTYSDSLVSMPCGSTYRGNPVMGRIIRRWRGTDPSGNVGLLNQNIFRRRPVPSDVVFPLNRDGVALPALPCGSDINDMSLTGIPLVGNTPVANQASCNILYSHWDSRVNGCSPGVYSIIRNWTAVDGCTGLSRTGLQIIKIEDKVVPTIVCPPNITSETTNASCRGIVTLPNATASDACSGVSTTATWSFGTGNGPFNNVPKGVHNVVYSATDQCGNTSTCTSTVTVVDRAEPTALCNFQVIVELNSRGSARAFALSFDNGSNDNCGIREYLVRKDSISSFTPSVFFDCNDLTAPVRVQLMVSDSSGNSSTCHSNVMVHDLFPPVITCPANAQIACTTDPTRTSQTGIATATDNCGIKSITYSDSSVLSTCKTGNIYRKWIALDNGDRSAICTQVITVVDSTPFSILFPPDFSTNVCGASVSPNNTGRPIIQGVDCETNIMATFSDAFFDQAQPACYKIIRTWKVIDWCNYNIQTNTGVWIKEQIILVKDEDAPVLTIPNNLTITTSDTVCMAYVLLAPAKASDCSNQLSINHNSRFGDQTGANASGWYPVGTTTVSFVATDGCGNATTRTMTITVQDNSAPIAACKTKINVSLTRTGVLNITANLIDAGSFDNCTPFSQLVRTITPTRFDCQTLGTQNVTMTIRDLRGNTSTCVSELFITDNFNACRAKSIFQGFARTETGRPIQGVEMRLTGDTINKTTFTDVNGFYIFDPVTAGKNYTIKPKLSTNPRQGVTATDVAELRKHALGVSFLNSAYKVISADANGNDQVAIGDASTITRVILQTSPNFGKDESWKFVDSTFVFANALNPFNPRYRDTIGINDSPVGPVISSFIGTKTGDLNSSVFPPFASSPQVRNEGSFLAINDQFLEKGKEYDLAFHSENWDNTQAWQYSLAHEGELEVLNVNPSSNFKETPFFSSSTTTQAVKMLMTLNPGEYIKENKTIFVARVKALKSANLSEILKNGSEMEGLISSKDGIETPLNLRINNLILPNEPEGKKMEIGSFFPNPFSSETNIMVESPTDQILTLKISDISGAIIHTQERMLQQGSNRLVITSNEFPNKMGVYIVSMITQSGFKSIQKLLLTGQ